MKKMKTMILALAVLVIAAGCGPSLKERKTESDIHYRMGVVHLNERNYTDALRELTRAVDLYGGDPRYQNALGLAYFARRMNDEAIVHLKEAIRLDDNYPDAHVNLAAVYIVKEDWDRAIEESGKALRNIFYATPEYAHFNMAWARYNLGEYQKAVEGFRKAIELNPDYMLAYYNLGLTYDRIGDIKGSIKAFEGAVKISPRYVDGYYRLGHAYIKGREKEKAMEAFTKVIELAPGTDEANSAREYIDLIR